MSNALDNLLSRLDGVKRSGDNQWSAYCPAHDDKNPSLSISLGDDGKVLIRCHAYCAPADVMGAVGLEMKDLFLKRLPDSGPLSKYQRRQHITAKDALKILSRAATVYRPVSYDLRDDKPFSEEHNTALTDTEQQIERLQEIING